MAKGVLDFKEKVAEHFSVSHGWSFTFIADTPLKDFEEIVTITRIRNKAQIQLVISASKSKVFYHAFRNSP